MKMKLMKNKKCLQHKFSRMVLVLQTTADFTLRVSKSYVPFTCKFPMVMHFVPILHKLCRSKTNFYVFSYDKTSFKFYASFRIFLAVFMEKIQKICYLYYVRRGIDSKGRAYPLSSLLFIDPEDQIVKMINDEGKQKYRGYRSTEGCSKLKSP